MAIDYKEHLAVEVLSEGRIVTYRALSRTLQIHVNAAKECVRSSPRIMLIVRLLYEFHRQQTAKKPGSVHATYLLGGVRRASGGGIGKEKDGDDEPMRSSPFMSRSVQGQEFEGAIPVKSLVVVREEDLEGVRNEFETITSIHVYSLEPQSLKDLHALAACNRELFAKYCNEDLLEVGRRYGMIQNANVKRRSRRGPAPVQAPVAPVRHKEVKTEAASVSSAKGSEAASPADSTASSTRAEKPGKRSAPKRGDSDLFKSFAKSKPKLKKEETQSSVGAEDEPMKDASEDEQEEDLALMTSKQADRESKAEREERLRLMMEVEDEPMDEEAPEEEDEEEVAEEPPPEAAPSPEPSPVDPPPVVSDGRRRGRRRVTKKKTVKDEDGYLVTREEQVWESFSEEEPAAAKVRTPASSAGGEKKDKGRPGQGNLMAWFKK
ncbi:MAG: hypothetical protein M1832_005406 [Thelocarpon impressellum]|nr:MAG: hypothetical protein M1832_005406 [Thelocarpon impressellum]